MIANIIPSKEKAAMHMLIAFSKGKILKAASICDLNSNKLFAIGIPIPNIELNSISIISNMTFTLIAPHYKRFAISPIANATSPNTIIPTNACKPQ